MVEIVDKVKDRVVKQEQETTIDPKDAWVQACLANPDFWNANEIYDWDKFYAQDPDGKLSRTYDSPLRYGLDVNALSGKAGIDFNSPTFDQGDKAFFLSPQLTDEDIAALKFKNKSATMTGDLFQKILGPNPDSSKVPEPFRNALFWMEGNHFAEELVSFNRWAWRSQSNDDNKNGRVVALGCMGTDWTNDPTKYGSVGDTPYFITLQESPCKKWYQFGFVIPDQEGKIRMSTLASMKMYVVQEGDNFVDRFGKPVPYLTPGSLLRLNWGAGDPYVCSPANITLMYAPRKVAVYNEETEKVEKYSPNYEALMVKVATKPPEGFTSFEYMTRQERYDLVTSMVSDKQIYRSASSPPSGDEIENL